jgi:hypothetical protein
VPKVYVVNKSCHDFTKAEEFGEIVFLTIGNVNRYATSNMYRKFEREMKKSSPEDYMLLSGMTVMSVIACGMFSMLHKRLNLLIWKSDRKEYIERIIKMEDLNESTTKD